MKKAKRISQGSVENGVVRNYVRPLIDSSTHIHCAARVVDLNSLAQLIIIIILYSLLRY